jgi:hypothetical protein
MPFVKTPIWIGSESLQHSFFAPLSKQWRQDIKAGGAKRELAIAKMGMGSMMMLGVGSYVADGSITGGGPGNTNLRKIYLDSGWRPYSFVFQAGEWDKEFTSYLSSVGIDPSIGKDGKLYVPFRGIDPIAGPMAMMADAVEYARYEDDEDKVAQVVLGAVWGLYDYDTSLSDKNVKYYRANNEQALLLAAAIENMIDGMDDDNTFMLSSEVDGPVAALLQALNEQGVEVVSPRGAVYQADVSHVREFVTFCRESGGFEVC